MVFFGLDLQFFAGEKTEKATPKKRQDSRKKGQVLKSQDVTSVLSAPHVCFFFTLRTIYVQWHERCFITCARTKYVPLTQ